MATKPMKTLTGPNNVTYEVTDEAARKRLTNLEGGGDGQTVQQRLGTLESQMQTAQQGISSNSSKLTALEKAVEEAKQLAQESGGAADGMTFNATTGLLQLTSGGKPIAGAAVTIKLSDYYTKEETDALIEDAVAAMAGSDAMLQLQQQAVGSLEWSESDRKLTIYNVAGEYLDELVIEGGGGGGTGTSYSVRVLNTLASTILTTASTSATVLKAKYLEYYGSDLTGQGGTLDVEYKLATDDAWKKLHTGMNIAQGVEFSIDVTNVLTVGKMTNVRFTVKGGESGLTRSLTYTITCVEAIIAGINFDDTATYTGNFNFQYRCTGRNLEKIVHFEMDGTEIAVVDIGTSHNETKQQAITMLGVYDYGSHLLRVWYTTPDGAVSNVLQHAILYDDGSSTAPIIGAVVEPPAITYGDALNVRYVLDTPGQESTDELQIRVYSINGDMETVYQTASLVNLPNNAAQVWACSSYPESGTVYIELRSGDTVETIRATVEEIDIGYNLQPVDTNLVYSFKPTGRSNMDADRGEYTHEFTTAAGITTKIKGTFEGFNWVSDGYDGEALTLAGEARHTIELPIFSTSYTDDEGQNVSLESAGNAQVTTNGRTIELEFMASSVTDLNAPIIHCMNDAHAGFMVTPQVVYLLSSSGTNVSQDETGFIQNEEAIPCAYIKDDKRIRLAFVIEPVDTENNRQCVNIYINGEFANSQPYDADAVYRSTEFIHFGSDTCILKLFDVRIYNRGLSADEVRQNYMVAPVSVTDKIAVLRRNDVMNDNGDVDYEAARLQTPCLLIIGELSPYKGNKKKCGAILTKPDGLGGYTTEFALLDMDEDGNFISDNNVQGTSSQKFMRKNLKLAMKVIALNEDGTPQRDAEGNIVIQKFKYSLKGKDADGNDLSIGESTLCYKIDYMSTNHPNTPNANLGDTLYADKTIAQQADPRCQTTIWGFRCLLFQTSAEEWPNGTIYFAGDGALNNDKSNSTTFGLECDGDEGAVTKRQKWEFLNNTNSICFFKTDRLFAPTSEGGIQAASALESTYPDQGDLEDEGLTPVYDYIQVLFTWVCQRANFWDASTETAATPYIYKGQEYTTERAYRKAIFVNEFGRHFNKHRALVYYLFMEFLALCDNRAKNMFLQCEDVTAENLVFTDPTVQSIHDIIDPDTGEVDADKIDWENSTFAVWLCILYDLDSCLGAENSGYLRIPYYADWQYTLNGANQFNGYDSRLWLMVEEAFAADIMTEAQRLTSNELLTYETLRRAHITENADIVCPAVVNRDMVYKYSDPWTEGYWDYSESTTNPTWVQNGQYKYLQRGSRVEQVDAYIYRRCHMLYSKYLCDQFRNNNINFRAGQNVEAADSAITMTAVQAMHHGVKYGDTGSTITTSPLAAAGIAVTIRSTQRIGRSDTVYLCGGTDLTDIGDVSAFYPYEMQLTKGRNLRSLTIGRDEAGYTNTGLAGLDLSACKLLEYINLMGCVGLENTIDMTGNTLIRTVLAGNSVIPYIKLPDGGQLETLKVGTVKNLTVLNHGNLQTFSMDSMESLTCLRVENTPGIPVLDILLQRLPQLTDGLRLVGIDVDAGDDMTIFEMLVSDKAKGKYLDNNGALSVDVNAYPHITGTIHCDAIGSVLLGQMETLYPELVIDYGQVVTQHAIRFVNDDDAATLLDVQYLTPGSMPKDPVTRSDNPIATPTKAMTISTIYTFSGWTPALNVVTGDYTYTATYTETAREYTVRHYVGSKQEQTKTVPYGSEVVYEGATPEDHSLDQYFIYRLFSHWDKCTSYVTGDMDVHAVFVEGSAPKLSTHPGWSLATATPIELYAMVKAGVLASNGGLNATPGSADHYGMVTSGDEFDIVMGNDADYDNVESVELVSLDAPLVFDGTTYHNTGVKLFDEDKSFTLAVDFAYTSSVANSVLLSCCQGTNGIRLHYSGNAMLQYGGVNAGAAVAATTSREMLVIRHRKGDPNLYVYSSNKTSNAIRAQTIRRDTPTIHSSTLAFGCDYAAADGYASQHAKGTIFWAKVWYEDLGVSLCSDLAIWPRETLTMQAAGVSDYNFRLHPIAGEDGQFSACVFLMKNLMEGTRRMNPTNTNAGGWPDTEMRGWLNERLYYSLPRMWRHLIRKVTISSTRGDLSTDIVTSEDYIWLPAAKEVNQATTTAGPMSEANGIINLFTDDASRIKYLNNGAGAASHWWLRSPHMTNATNFYGISSGGWYSSYGASLAGGVCFGFCI